MSGMIRLDSKYGITVDSYNYILQRISIGLSGKSEGKECLNAVGYFSDLSGALMAYYRECVRDKLRGDLTGLSDALRGIREASDYVAGIIKSAVPEYRIVEVVE